MRAILIVCLLACFASSYGKKIKWYDGAVVLNDSHVLVGEISIESACNLILLRVSGSVTVYTAYKVQSFHFYDAEENINRKFLSLKDNEAASVRNYQFYEVVLRGDVKVLRKQKPGFGKADGASDCNNFNYFVQKDNHVTNLTKFRKNILPILLQSFNDQIFSFIHQNNLNPNLPGDAIRVIEFYNKQVTLYTVATM